MKHRHVSIVVLAVAGMFLALPLHGPDAPLPPATDATPQDGATPPRGGQVDACAVTPLLPFPPPVAMDAPCSESATSVEQAEGVAAASGSGTFAFENMAIPGAVGAGEPTMGVTPAGNIFFQEGTTTWKSADGGATWARVATVPPEFPSIDPLLWVDGITGRVFVTHLYGACSHTWMSDTEGASWTYVPATCGTPVNDHQKLATGPYASPAPPTAVGYANAVYYCYNGLVYGACALSTTGGLTWQPAVPIPCGGMVGHPHVRADGLVVVPSDHCGEFNGAAVSRDNGLTWTTITTQSTGLRAGGGIEPDVASTPDGTLYMSATVDGPGDSHLPYAFVSTDDGATWSAHDLAGDTGVQSIVFPVVTAGADGRAAVAFHGTTEARHPGLVSSTAAWHLYVAVTYDAGATWQTVRATPDTAAGPVQRGPICLNGLACGDNRNLLEFMDVVLDQDGYVLVGYADGCIHSSCKDSLTSEHAQGTVARQTAGAPLR